MQFRLLGPLEVVDDGDRSLALGGRKQRSRAGGAAAARQRASSRPSASSTSCGATRRPPRRPRASRSTSRGCARSSATAGCVTRAARLRAARRAVRARPGPLSRRWSREAAERRARHGGRDAARGARAVARAGAGRPRLRALRPGATSRGSRSCASARSSSGSTPISRSASTPSSSASSRRSSPSTRCASACAAQLMLALYRSGRQAEALEAYQAARTTLVEELGIEPGRALRELQQAILGQDAELDARRARRRCPSGARPRGVFVGRERELAEPSTTRWTTRSAGRGARPAHRGRARDRQEPAGRGARRAARGARGARVLVGRCWEAGGAPAYWPWVQALRAYVRGRDPEALREPARAGAADLAQLLPELRELLPDLPSRRARHRRRALPPLRGGRRLPAPRGRGAAARRSSSTTSTPPTSRRSCCCASSRARSPAAAC